MAIYHIFQEEKKTEKLRTEEVDATLIIDSPKEDEHGGKDRFLSSLCARLFFLILLGLDILWFCLSTAKIVVFGAFYMLFMARVSLLRAKLKKAFLAIKRSLVCGLSLVVAFINPAFGIMIACTYFLMYDKEGIDEVIPASLKEQFKDLFSQNSQTE